MKTRVYLRVARDKKRRTSKVVATGRPNSLPLPDHSSKPLPTVAFALDLEIPDSLFAQAEQVIATIAIPESAATIVADVYQEVSDE